MPFSCGAGDTIWLPDSGGGHRYILLTTIYRADKTVVVANYTDYDFWQDRTTILTPEDDQLLFNKISCMNYSDAHTVSSQELFIQNDYHKNNKRFLKCSDKLLKRILIGAISSDYTRDWIKKRIGHFYPKEFSQYYTAPDI
jgi:hypothetical protein